MSHDLFGYNAQLRTRAFVVKRARAAGRSLKSDFVDWLEKNFPIWERFEREANKVYARNRKHYSARTIGEYLRHETALSATDDGEWKLNDHRWPDLARLYLAIYPEREGFFELRQSPQRKEAA